MGLEASLRQMRTENLTRSQLSLLGGAGALAAMLYVQCGGWTLTARSLLRLLYSSQGGFQLAIKIKFESESDLETWSTAWRPLARHCRLREPHTLSYEMARSDKEPLQILVFERYTNKQALTAIHQKSRPFLDFKERVRGLNTQTEGMSYLESGIGYM